MSPKRLLAALSQAESLGKEISEAAAELRQHPDPLALHIFQARRRYREMGDTKGGKRHETYALNSYRDALDLGYPGDLGEWKRLLGAIPKNH